LTAVFDYLAAVGKAAADRFAAKLTLAEELTAIAAEVWQSWADPLPEPERRAGLAALAAVSPDDLAEATRNVLDQVPANYPVEIDKHVAAYLEQLPSCARRLLRRPSDPTGTSFSRRARVDAASDLLPFLPPRLSHFRMGDEPPGADDWELIELLAVDDGSETWMARFRHRPEPLTATLEFLLDVEARDRMLATEAVFDQVVREARYPGMVLLQHVYYYAAPPALRSEHLVAPDLTGLLTDWEDAPARPSPAAIGKAFQRLVEIVAQAHRLQPALVHTDLRPGNILVLGEGEDIQWKIAGWGTGRARARTPLAPSTERALRMGSLSSSTAGRLRLPLYASLQQMFGEAPDPRDDVFALGVLWFQLLTGHLARGCPRGGQWRRRLAEAGTSTAVIELLEACFEDDRADRPADAVVLLERMDAALRGAPLEPLPPPGPVPRLEPAVMVVPVPANLPPLPAPEIASERPPRRRSTSVAEIYERLQEAAPEMAKAFTSEVAGHFVLIPAGSFRMGSPEAEACRRSNEGPLHDVSLSRPFYLAIHTVTQQVFDRVMAGRAAMTQKAPAANHPVVGVFRAEALEFCRVLSELPAERNAGRRYRLPTEAEWEYACRAGTLTPFWNGVALSSAQANFHGQFPYGNAPRGPNIGNTTPVGAYPPNPYGLFDMHGNVWEWCSDWYDSDYYRRSPKVDPPGPERGQFGVVRGGCWRNHAGSIRAAYRNALVPEQRDPCTGFRVACALMGGPPG